MPKNNQNNSSLSPIYHVQAIPIEKIHANSYNPNHVATPEFNLLQTSIIEDGYTQPIVCCQREDGEYEIIDGYHRYLAMKKNPTIKTRENGTMPVVILSKDEPERIAATIRHNRARGTHEISLMQKIITELVEIGRSDNWIKKHLGMDLEEITRLKQLSGLLHLFHNSEYTPASTEESIKPPGKN